MPAVGPIENPRHEEQCPSREPTQVGAKRRPEINHLQHLQQVHPGVKAGDTNTSSPDRDWVPWG